MALIARLTSVVLTSVVLTTLAALAGVAALAPPAQAATGYKFWGYYHLTDGKWAASMKGADGFTAQDGDVEGFRYATTISPNRPPRAMPTFADICAGTQAPQGQKRVGIVLDYGTPQDAPEGQAPPQAEAECAVVPRDASTQQALESVQPLRIEGGLVCAIAGYPASGCAVEVADPAIPKTEQPVDVALPSEGEQQSAEESAVGPVVGVGALVLVLGGGAVVLARRRA
jgi:hypothetical protein